MKKEKVPEKNHYLEYHLFRSFPHSRSKLRAMDCKPEEMEAREYVSGVKISRGGKGDAPTAWDDIIPEKAFKWAVKPKGKKKKGLLTIRKIVE